MLAAAYDKIVLYFEAIVSAPLWALGLQLGLAVLATLVALASSVAVRRSLGRRAGDRTSSWHFTLIALATVSWAITAAVAAIPLPSELMRFIAWLATGTAITALVFHLIGFTALGWAVSGVAILAIVLASLDLLSPVVDALDSPALMLGELRVSPWFAARGVLIVCVTFWVAQQLGNLLDRGVSREAAITRSGQALITKLGRAALILLACLFSLGLLGVDVTALAVLSGAVGLGLGFGLQNVVSNYVSGLILLLDRSIKPGDVIEVDLPAGRIRGEVTELAGRYTAITLRTGTETLIPNEMLVSNAVSNWSHTSRNVQLRIPVGVAYTANVEQAMTLCKDAATETPRVLGEPGPTCFITGFGDSSVDLEVRFWISDAENGVRNVSSDVYLHVWRQFKEHGIEIPFPQRDLHIRSSVPLAVSEESSDPERQDVPCSG